MNTILWLLLAVVLSACSKSVSPPDVQTPVIDTTAGFLALGDSYTIGQSVPAPDRFAAQTVTMLRQGGVRISDPVYIAQTGWTTVNLLDAIALQNPPPQYKIVTLLIGVNDQFQGMDTGNYTARFTQLLERAITLARSRRTGVFVLSIPDYSVTPFVNPSDKERVRREVDLFNAINRRITTSYGISYTDITPSSREAATDPTLLANDGLHPSGKEYRKWAALLAPKVKVALD